MNQNNRILPFTTDEIYNLIKLYGTPLQLYDGESIKKNALNFMYHFKSCLPGFKQFFAVKALPNPNILKLLVDCGMGLDCSSISELKLAQKINISGNNIIFTSNFTSQEELKYALDMNVIINLDDISLIPKLYSINNSLPNILFLRFNPGIGKTDSETKSNILGGPNAKFGMDEETIINACKMIYKNTTIGIHVMTGSNILDINYWKELINIIFQLLIKLKNNNIKINFVNLGGGIGIDYISGNQININDFASTIKTHLIINSNLYDIPIPIIYMENGRFITGPYGYLISKCNCVKYLYNKTFYGLDACMSNLMRPGMYNSYHHISILNKNTQPQLCNVVGTLCENNDWFAKDRLLPKAECEDIFIIWDTGAHSHSMGFQYNGKLRAPEILFISQEFKLIRRKETFDDYIQTLTLI